MLDKVVVALGFFDSVHIGHRSVIKSARKIADSNNAKLVVISFSGNLRKAINGESEKYIYTDCERESLIKNIGADQVFFAPCTKEFLSLERREFLDLINQKFNIIAYVCGLDYRFGKNALGDVNFLSEYAKEKEQDLSIVKYSTFNGEKVSTKGIKSLLFNGEIELANNLLVDKYTLSGVVENGRKVGRTIGFPTINFAVDVDRQPLKNGVYLGHTEIDNKIYKAIINYGNRPTFSLDERVIEAHILDFDGDLYGKKIKLVFDKFIRDIIKFDDINELKIQLEKDAKKASKLEI